MASNPRFDLYQFDPDMHGSFRDELRGKIDGDEIGSGFQLQKTRLVEKEIPEWAMTYEGLAAVALMAGSGFKARNGNEINHARRASVAYLYFRLHMTADRVAKYLAINEHAVQEMVRRMRQMANGVRLATTYEGYEQLKISVTSFLRERAKTPRGTRAANVEGAAPHAPSACKPGKSVTDIDWCQMIDEQDIESAYVEDSQYQRTRIEEFGRLNASMYRALIGKNLASYPTNSFAG